jgi:hypothetical protein
MLWFYGRGSDTLAIETRYDDAQAVYELIWYKTDGSQTVEQFPSQAEFQARTESIESTLKAENWVRKSSPTILPDGWRTTKSGSN